MPTSWKVCLDDTCDEKRKDFICVGALIGRKDGWNRFNKEWRRVLNRHPSIDYFHGKDLPKLQGPFAKFRDQQLFPRPTGMDAAVMKRTDLQKVIKDSTLVGLGIGVLLPEYHEIRDTHPRGKTFMAKDAFEYVLQELVYRATKTIAEFDTRARVSFVSDKSERSAVYELVYEKWKESNRKTAAFMLGISHEDDKTYFGLQGADMVASAVNRVYRSNVKDGVIPDEYPLSEAIFRIGKIDRNYLLTMLGHQSPRKSEHHFSTSPLP